MWDNLKLHQDKVHPCYVLWNTHCKLLANLLSVTLKNCFAQGRVFTCK